MVSIKINEFSSHVQKEIMGYFLLKEFSKSANRGGARWRTAEIEDKTGRANTVLWDENFQEEYLGYVNNVVKVIGQVTMKNGQYQLTISQMELAKDGEYTIEDFASSLSGDYAGMCSKLIREFISDVENTSVKNLLETIFTEKMIAGLCKYPASLKYNHPYNGGLISHILETTRIAVSISDTEEMLGQEKPYHQKVNTSLVVAGALLHDIGLIYSYVPYPFAKKTQKGELIGHTSMSLDLLHKACAKMESKGSVLSNEDIMQIEHIIVSATSDRNPMTKEALIVCKANTVSKSLSSFDVTLGSENADISVEDTIYNPYVRYNIYKGGDK